MTEATTHTIDAPGAVLTYDIRPGIDADTTPLVMVASPMAAAGFTTLARPLHRPHRGHLRP